jgi:hypothetical protein
MVISNGIPAVPRNRKPRNSVPNPFAEEKTTRNSVTLNKNRSELSEFPSEHFSGRENSSEFLSVDTKIEEYSHNSPHLHADMMQYECGQNNRVLDTKS